MLMFTNYEQLCLGHTCRFFLFYFTSLCVFTYQFAFADNSDLQGTCVKATCGNGSQRPKICGPLDMATFIPAHGVPEPRHWAHSCVAQQATAAANVPATSNRYILDS
jgi:hypothetical protein